MGYGNEIATVAIIGCGPRGLSALESLYSRAATEKLLVKVIVFEQSVYPGAGPVYHIRQPDSNWLNVSERALGIPARDKVTFEKFVLPKFPDFQEWSSYSEEEKNDSTVDNFPFRSTLGKYLHARYISIASILETQGLLQYANDEVCSIDFEDNHLKITVFNGQNFSADETVLTIGHQHIELDDQLVDWVEHLDEKNNLELFLEPYPVKRIIASQKIGRESTVGIRGFGLAMIDVVRALTEGRNGRFSILDETTREMTYQPHGNEPKLLVPFSLDGLPMTPKPLNKKIDAYYVPSKQELASYEQSLEKAIRADHPPTSTEFLIAAIVPLVSGKYLDLPGVSDDFTLTQSELRTIIKQWLSDEDFRHELILAKDNTAEDMMKSFIQMATANRKASLDYCTGQVWRHCQPTMYRILSFAPFSDELIADIVSLDERLKRYSYGPPVDSLQQVLALLKSGNMTFHFVNDPQIETTGEGWELSAGAQSVLANAMINSVLDAPQVLKVTSPLVKTLLNESLVEPLHDTLGIRTNQDGSVQTKSKSAKPPLAVLGRLAKGTLIGVDAIAECFGLRSQYWAAGVFERLKN